MYEHKSIGVVVPAYNEEGFVGDVIDRIPSFVDRVYAIDDRSTDGTWKEITRRADAPIDSMAGVESMSGVESSSREEVTTADEFASGDGSPPEVLAIRHEDNRGVGGAIKTGYSLALRDGISVIAIINGDGQMDPAILDRIIAPVVTGQAGYAKGDRLHDSRDRAEMPRWRVFGNFLLTYLTRIATGYWRMNDPQNGYTAISADVLDRIEFEDLYEGFGFLNDLLVRLNANQVRIADVGMRSRYGEERSSITYRTFVPRLSWLLLGGLFWRIRVKYVAEFHPLALFYGLGTVGFVIGFLWLALVGAGVARILNGWFTPIGAFALGWTSVLAGLFLDRRVNGNLETRVGNR